MTSLEKVGTNQEGYTDHATPQGDRPSLITFPKSATELVLTSTMEGIEPSHNETFTRVEARHDSKSDDRKLDHDDYTVAWICPLQVEEIAALKMLDVRHQPLSQHPNDHNAYTLGSINGHNVVIASLPVAGNTHAATVVTQTKNTFPYVRFALLVGIGGGVPTTTDNGPIRLGHVVVSKPTGTHSGAVQYDHGKVEHHEHDSPYFKRTGFLAPPPAVLLGAARKLDVARAVADSDPIIDHLKRIDTNKPNLRGFKCPGIDKDHLYKPEYVHLNRKVSCRKSGCDPKERVDRCDDSEDEFQEIDPSERIVVHGGTIASGEWVMKNGLQRDEWAEKDDILCFEMEAAGALADFPCLVIRGVSDYADSHKNDRWQGFAAAIAAAYARELFFHMPVAEVKKLRVTEADVKTMVTETGNLVQSQLNAKIKAWLSPPDPSTNYNAASAKHLHGTGSWFIQSREFSGWRTTRSASALWLYGSPGCGKTILTYAVIQELRKDTNCSAGKGIILYYFFDFNDVEKQSPDNMIRSMVFQLSRSCKDAAKHLESLFAKNDNGNSKPSIQSLCTTFQAMLVEAIEPMIILDALDECTTRNDKSSFGGQRLLDWLGQLRCRILITSRREEDIESSMEGWQTKTVLSMQNSPVDEDIRAYVHQYLRSPDTNELAKTWQSTPEILDQIEKKVLEKAAGMFRWVACQLDALAEHRMRHRLFAALESLPTTLTETYRRILQGIPEIHQEDTARLLQLLLYAKKPLTTKEAADALAVTPESEQPFEEENRPSKILSYCSNLAIISAGNYIWLAHFSVKEYLTSSEDKGPFTKLLRESEAEASLAEVSLAYISCLTGNVDSNCRTYHWRSDWMRDKYPLAGYCARYWMDHARVAEQSNQAIREKVFNFISCRDEMPYIICLFIYNPDGDSGTKSSFPPLYLASLLGLKFAVKRLIDKGADVNEHFPGTAYGYALQAACDAPYIEIIRILLENGANANLPGGEDRRTALLMAVSYGFDEVARLLLDSGADPNIKGDYREELGDDWVETRPLHVAASNGWKGLVELLLEKGADIHGDSEGGTALSVASRWGHKEMVKLLLQHGAIIDQNVLSAASSCGRIGVVRILLEKLRLDPSMHYFCNKALQVARADTADGQDVIELLLNHGADIDSFEKDGKTALESKVISGTESDALYLIGKGATRFRVDLSSMPTSNIPCAFETSQDNDHERLFRASCWKGWCNLLRLLLTRNTDAQISQRLYNDGLQIASYMRLDPMVELLLNHGSDVNGEPGEFGDALQAASACGNLNIVRRLLAQGADANRVDNHGWSPFSIAFRSNHKAVSEELLHVSSTETLVESHDSSRCIPPSTFVSYGNNSCVTIDSNECVVETGPDDTEQLVRADHPFVATKRKCYFEIKVLSLGSEGIIGLGVCGNYTQPGEKMPGWYMGSWGFHGDDGKFYSGCEPAPRYGPIFRVNDIVGCCVDYEADQLFFTRNGKYLGCASKAPTGRLFAAIGVAAGARVSFDFGASCPVSILEQRSRGPRKRRRIDRGPPGPDPQAHVGSAGTSAPE